MNPSVAVLTLLTVTIMVVILLAILFLGNEWKKKGPGYDERQIAVRGRAYTISWWVGILYFFAVAVWNARMGELPMETHLVILFGLLLQCVVLHTYAIVKDAFISLRERSGTIGFLYLLLGANQMVFFFANRVDDLSWKGEGAFGWWNLILGVCFLYLGTLVLLWPKLRKED